MFGSSQKGAPFAALCSLFLAACGGNLDIYNLGEGDGGDSGASAELDAGGEPSDLGSGSVDASTTGDTSAPMTDAAMPDPPDMPPIDMGEPEPEDPTTNVAQSGPTVASLVTSQCSTGAVKGLSLQLLEQMNCERPGTMKSFAGAPGVTYGSNVFPFQQGPATDALLAAAASRSGSIPINSALRTLPQQYLLYEWYLQDLCNANLAAPPGASNHNGGLAVDINDSSLWRPSMRNRSYIDNVSGEPWHFYYSGAGGVDVRNLSVLAFQKLYNRNFPENRIDEDGSYGPQTRGALRASPANGFTLGPRCTQTMMMVSYPNGADLEVLWERIADNFIGIRTVAPSGIRLVEYFIGGELVGFSDQVDGGQFETVLQIPHDLGTGARLEVFAHDAWGEVKGRASGLIDAASPEPPVFVRPLGGVNFEIGVEDLPVGVASVEYYIDGIPTAQSPRLAVSSPKAKRLATQLDRTHTIDVVLLDKRDRVLFILTRTFDSNSEE